MALIITFFIYTPITNFIIENTELDNKIENIIIEKGVTNDENTTEDGVVDKYVTQSINNTKNDIVKSTSAVISQKVIGIMVALLVFIGVRLLLIFAKILFNGIAKLPIIKQFNEVGGLLYGVLRGVVLVYIILAIMFFVISINSVGTIANAVNTSFIAKILYSNNIILNIIF